MRQKLPTTTERTLLIRNKHCCCICQKDGHGKEINVHHIDGNNSNNAVRNLAVLCLVHASQADAGLAKGKLGSGKKLKPDAVTEYKYQWEKRIQEESRVPKKQIPTFRKRQLGVFFYNEIQKTKHEIIALDAIDPKDKTIEVKFAFLDSLIMEEYAYDIKVKKYLMEAFTYIAFMATDSGTLLIECLMDSLENLIVTYESEFRISREEVRYLRASIEALAILGDTIASFNNNPATLKIVCAKLFDIGKTTKAFKVTAETQRVMRALYKIKKSCLDFRVSTKAITVKQQQIRQAIVETEIVKLKRPKTSLR
jgi:hypothetical protein